MSYDVYIEAKFEGVDETVALTGFAETTWNLAMMFEVLKVGRPSQWDGLRAGKLLPRLKEALRELEEHESDYTQFNSSNGWGSTDSTKVFLEQVIDMCSQYEYGTVRCE